MCRPRARNGKCSSEQGAENSVLMEVWSNKQGLHRYPIQYELWKILLLFLILQPAAFIMYIYALVSLYTAKAIKHYLIDLPDKPKILSYTDHNNWLAIAVLLPQDWKAADSLCVWNNGLDVWVGQWEWISNQTENTAIVTKQNAIIQLESGQNGRQIRSVLKKGSTDL